MAVDSATGMVYNRGTEEFHEAINGEIRNRYQWVKELDTSTISMAVLVGISFGLPSQRWAPLITNEIADRLNWTSINPREKSGDFKDSRGNNYEVKITSQYHSGSNLIHAVQVRPGENFNYVAVFSIDIHARIRAYFLTKEEIISELAAHQNQSAHGGGKNSKEQRLTFEIGSDSHKRWEANYLNRKVTSILND